MEDGSLWQFSRFYEDFYDLQVALLKNFPDEAGTRGGGERVIPFLPGPMPYVTDALTEMRQEQLNTYLRQLVALDLRLSRSIFVKGFFSPKQGDFELDPDAPTDYSRYSQASMNSNHGAGVNSSQQAHRQQYGNNNGASQSPNQQYMGMGNSNERQFSYGQGQVPIQPSRLDDMYQDQNELGSSQQSNAPPGSSAAAIKFKLHYEDNIFVVRVPPDITFNQLRYKVLDRCNVQHDVEISYKDEARSGGLVPLLSDRDWMYAVENAEKLGLYVS